MQLRNSESAYGLVAVSLHWVIALLVVAMLGVGFFMDDLQDPATRLMAFRLHAIVGATVVALTLFRILWAVKNQRLAAPAGAGPTEQLAAKGVHMLLNLLVLVMGASGVGTVLLGGLLPILTGASGEPLPDELHDVAPAEVHEAVAVVVIALIVLHVAAAVFHHRVRRDNVLKRMAPWVPGA